MPTTAAILQPSYLSWPGHFYWMKNSDVFILLDDVQYTRQDWRNRNYIKGPNGKQLLTVPVHWYGNSYCAINKITVDNKQNWAGRHLNALRLAYGRAPHFKEYFPYFEMIFSKNWEFLSDLTVATMKDLAAFLDIRPRFVISSDLSITADNTTEKLVKLCQAVGADTYLAGRRGYDNYIDHKLFHGAGIGITVKDYQPIEYPQLWGGFTSHLSVVDLLFNCGKDSPKYIVDKPEMSAACPGLSKEAYRNASELSMDTWAEGFHASYAKNEYDSLFFKQDVYSFFLSETGDSLTHKQLMPRGLIVGRIPAGMTKALQQAVQYGFEILCTMADLEFSLE